MNYYKDELLNLIGEWTVEQLDGYIEELEDRLTNTKDQIREIRALRRRKLKNKNPKDRGEM